MFCLSVDVSHSLTNILNQNISNLSYHCCIYCSGLHFVRLWMITLVIIFNTLYSLLTLPLLLLQILSIVNSMQQKSEISGLKSPEITHLFLLYKPIQEARFNCKKHNQIKLKVLILKHGVPAPKQITIEKYKKYFF